MRNLQEEVSGLKRDKENAVDASQQKNKRPRDDKHVGESENNAKTHHAHNGESSEEDSGTSDTEAGNIPKAYTVSTEGEAFLETTFGSKLDYAARLKQVDKIVSRHKVSEDSGTSSSHGVHPSQRNGEGG